MNIYSHQNANEEDTPHSFRFYLVHLSTRGHHAPGSRVRGYQSSMPHDDSTTEAAVTAAAVTTLGHLQTMREGMTAVFAEEPGLGGSGVGGDEIDRHS